MRPHVLASIGIETQGIIRKWIQALTRFLLSFRRFRSSVGSPRGRRAVKQKNWKCFIVTLKHPYDSRQFFSEPNLFLVNAKAPQ